MDKILLKIWIILGIPRIVGYVQERYFDSHTAGLTISVQIENCLEIHSRINR